MKLPRMALIGVLLWPFATAAQSDDLPDRFALKFGALSIYDSDTDVVTRGGTILGTNINFERDLGGDDTASAARIAGYYRFNPHHRVDFGWYKIDRDGKRTIRREIGFGDVVFPLTASVDSAFELEVAKLAYTWSFYHVDKVELGLSVGTNLVDYNFRLTNADRTIREKESVTQILPVFGLRMDYTINPRWHFLFDLETFYVESTSEFRGSMSDLQTGIEYRPFRHVSFGAALGRVAVDARVEDDDFTGSIADLYRAAQLYVGLRF